MDQKVRLLYLVAWQTSQCKFDSVETKDANAAPVCVQLLYGYRIFVYLMHRRNSWTWVLPGVTNFFP